VKLILHFIKKTCLYLVPFFFFMANAQKEMDLKGVLVDQNEVTIPFASVSLLKKLIGTSSNEDGGFLLTITENDLEDYLLINCIGYNSLKIKISDFLKIPDKKIVITENVTTLNEVKIISAKKIIENVIAKLKTNSISTPHQLNMLYRITAGELGKAKFFREYYIKVKDKGFATPGFLKYAAVERRQSADYRILKAKEGLGTFENVTKFNDIREISKFKKVEWEKVDDTNYGDEDVIVLKSKKSKKNKKNYKIYVGLDTFAIYRFESNGSLFIYNKGKNGKLHLSYHKREWKTTKNVKNDPIITSYLKKIGESNPEKLRISLRHEYIVLDVITEKNKMNIRNSYNEVDDNGDLKIRYNASFWDNLKAPPETSFFKNIKKELEENYGVPFEDQLKLANRSIRR